MYLANKIVDKILLDMNIKIPDNNEGRVYCAYRIYKFFEEYNIDNSLYDICKYFNCDPMYLEILEGKEEYRSHEMHITCELIQGFIDDIDTDNIIANSRNWDISQKDLINNIRNAIAEIEFPFFKADNSIDMIRNLHRYSLWSLLFTMSDQ